MKITIIVSVYKNTKALKLVLDSILNQSVKVDEIIISEDGDSTEMEEFISTLDIKNLIHLTQEDLGWQKNIALNNSIKKSSGDYLIFIDGDVVLHKRFVEGHIYCSKPKRVCAGKRASLGEKYSQKIYDGILTIDELADSYIRKIIPLHKDNVKHYENGIYIKPESFLYNNLIQKRRVTITGCNFSCYKKDFESINGFNEDYKLPSVGEDTDINWRFIANGVEVVSCRNIANMYHLWHKKGFNASDQDTNYIILKANSTINRFICLNGLQKLKDGEKS